MRRKVVASVVGMLLAGVALTGCTADRRQIDPAVTGSFRIEGTSWYGFCQGRNAFIWVPSRSDEYPDELEAVIYDDYRCANKIDNGTPGPAKSSKPDTDPDGVVDDEE